MKIIKRTYEELDFFGQSFRLNIDGNYTIRTSFGSFLGLCFIGLVLISIWLIGNDIIYHKKPQLNVQDDYLSERVEIPINFNTYSFAICMQAAEDMHVFYDESFFKYEIHRIELNNTNGVVISDEEIPTEKCKSRHFPNFPEEEFVKRGLFNYYCPKYLNTTIRGYWDEPTGAYLLLKLKQCTNGTVGGPVCATQEKIDSEIRKYSYSWNIYMQNSFVDTNDYLSPIKYLIFNLGSYISVQSSRLEEFYITSLISQTDRGSILEEFFEDKAYMYDFVRSFAPMDYKYDTYFDYYIWPSVKKTTYTRRYIKAQVIFANLGGIIKAFMLSFKILNYIFSVQKLNEIFINNLFELYEAPEKNYKGKKESMISEKPLKKHLYDKSSRTSISSMNEIQDQTKRENPGEEAKQENQEQYDRIDENRESKNIEVVGSTPGINSESSFKNTPTEKTEKKEKNDNGKYHKVRKVNNVISGNSAKNPQTERNSIIIRKSQTITPINVNLTFCELLKKYFVCCSKDKKFKQRINFINSATGIVTKRLDIIRILQKTHEIDNLKVVLFSKEQLSLFCNMTKYQQDKAVNRDIKCMYEIMEDRNKMLEIIKKTYISNQQVDNMTERLLKYLSVDASKLLDK